MNIREKIQTVSESGIRRYRRTYEADKPDNRAVQVFGADGKVIHKSRNLRGILDYSRKNPVELVVVEKLPGGEAQVSFNWPNGEYAVVPFASFDVAKGWVNRRALGNPQVKFKEAKNETEDSEDGDDEEAMTPEQFSTAIDELQSILKDLVEYAKEELEDEDSVSALNQALENITKVSDSEE